MFQAAAASSKTNQIVLKMMANLVDPGIMTWRHLLVKLQNAAKPSLRRQLFLVLDGR